jgi:rSAM/selenodomain-associated transferase 1
MTENHLIIFVKNRIAGKTKTRLARTIGNDKALAIYEELLACTHSVTAPLQYKKWVFFSEYTEENSLWGEGYEQAVQVGKDLGERMHNAFEKCFAEGAKRVCIIGTDCFELETQHLQTAFEKLEQNDMVVGPADDGGYYLLGLQEQQPELFLNKTWSTPDVLAETLETSKHLGLKVEQLSKLHDLDDENDLKRYLAIKNNKK